MLKIITIAQDINLSLTIDSYYQISASWQDNMSFTYHWEVLAPQCFLTTDIDAHNGMLVSIGIHRAIICLDADKVFDDYRVDKIMGHPIFEIPDDAWDFSVEQDKIPLVVTATKNGIVAELQRDAEVSSCISCGKLDFYLDKGQYLKTLFCRLSDEEMKRWRNYHV